MDTRLGRAHELLDRADQQLVRLNRLVVDLLDVTRIASDKLDLCLTTKDLGDIVREVVDTQRLAWPSRTITLDVAAESLPQLVLDADRVGQVVTNYLTNALKYSMEDKPVAVVVSSEQSGGGGVLKVSVRDEGPGLTPEALGHLWEPFHRVEGIRQLSGSGVGLGLGLHICKTFAERHGGSVGVESVPGSGSTFWFTLPLEATCERPDTAG